MNPKHFGGLRFKSCKNRQSKTLKFGKSVNDNGSGMFTRMLEYKCELYNEGERLRLAGTVPKCDAKHDRD